MQISTAETLPDARHMAEQQSWDPRLWRYDMKYCDALKEVYRNFIGLIPSAQCRWKYIGHWQGEDSWTVGWTLWQFWTALYLSIVYARCSSTKQWLVIQPCLRPIKQYFSPVPKPLSQTPPQLRSTRKEPQPWQRSFTSCSYWCSNKRWSPKISKMSSSFTCTTTKETVRPAKTTQAYSC